MQSIQIAALRGNFTGLMTTYSMNQMRVKLLMSIAKKNFFASSNCKGEIINTIAFLLHNCKIATQL